jgi:hypothetical protein
MEENDAKSEYIKIYNKLNKLKNYDKVGFVDNLRQWIGDLYFFYNRIAINANNLDEAQKCKYDLPKNQMPQIGQIAYFNIGRGYPKELYDGHWCLVIMNLNNNMVIIPTTSIKSDGRKIDNNIEMEISIKDFEEEGNSRLRINQIRSIDLMRIHKEKKIYSLNTDFTEIKNNIIRILGLDIDKNS